MKKRFISMLIIISIILSVFFLASCAAKADSPYPEYSGGSRNEMDLDNSAEESGESLEETTPNRKIIYSASVSFSLADFPARVNAIKAALEDGEWFDKETISENSAYFVARVKTSRLDAFINEITKGVDSANIQKDARDISLNYQSTEDQILALTEEKDLLKEYLEDNSISASYAITRIAEINTQIQRLNGTLTNYDSLIEYSTITINIYRKDSVDDPTYNERAGKTLSGAWEALISFFGFLGLAIVAIFPWLIVIIPVGAGIIMLIRYKKRLKPFHKIPKKNQKGTPDNKDNISDSTDQE